MAGVEKQKITDKSSLECHAEESDTRIWRHVLATSKQFILIMSPDTDVYHIGLTQTEKNVIVQLNVYHSKQLSFLHLPRLKHALQNDPDLSTIPPDILPKVIQTLYICTGCDYTSFFRGIGKITFSRYFYQYADFITSGKGNTQGTLADTGPANFQMELGYMSFVRLVGTVYFKKYSSGFDTSNPHTHFNMFLNPGITHRQHHLNWLDCVREKVWERVQDESEVIPSNNALFRHWKRTCWVVDMWGQATN